MKGKTRLALLVVALVVVTLVATGSAAAQDARTVCTGTETMVQMIDQGRWTYRGPNIHVRGMVVQYQEDMDCPQGSGLNTVTINANWDANFAGSIWGTSHLESAEGVWEGRWSGTTFADGRSGYRAAVHGVSGGVDGMNGFVTGRTPRGGGPAAVTMTILDPHGG